MPPVHFGFDFPVSFSFLSMVEINAKVLLLRCVLWKCGEVGNFGICYCFYGIYMCMYVYTNVYTYTNIHTYIYMYIYI